MQIMKLVLASQGFTTKEIAQATADLAGKSLNNLSVAIINEAYAAIDASCDQKWLIDELSLLSRHIEGG